MGGNELNTTNMTATDFDKIIWRDALTFVDFFATWCGPCQIMAKQIFPQQKVGEFFNKTFVNAKFDAEKGEGVDVAKRYSVKAYPTFLILDSDGEEVGRIVGGADADRFIEEVRKVLENIER